MGLIPVEPDTMTAAADDYITAASGAPINIPTADWTIPQASAVGSFTITSGGGAAGGGGGATTTQTLSVYDLTLDQFGTHPAGPYALEQVNDGTGAQTGWRLIPVEPDTMTAAADDYITAASGAPINIPTADWTIPQASAVGSFTITSGGGAAGGATGGTNTVNGNGMTDQVFQVILTKLLQVMVMTG